ncbi:MAG: 30S ribosomal protein S24e [Candidatus Aenigmatarchaeota archaeon]
MELEVIEEKENPFLRRKELKILVKHSNSPTPSKKDLIKELASKYSIPEDKIVIDYIFTKKGLQESLVKAKIKESDGNEAQTS